MPRSTDSPPPPYSHSALDEYCTEENVPPSSAFVKIRSAQDAKAQLQKYVTEILAFSLGADLDALHTALYPEARATENAKPGEGGSVRSLLSAEERSELLALSTTIQDFHEAFRRGGWILTSNQNREALVNAVVKPIVGLKSCIPSDAGFVLDMIATYANHQCQPDKRNLTQLARYIPRRWSSFSTVVKGFLWDIGNIAAIFLAGEDHEDIRPGKYSKHETKEILRTYTDIIELLSPNEGARLVLGRALIRTQKELAIKTLGMDDRKYSIWLPYKGKYSDMSEDLAAWHSGERRSSGSGNWSLSDLSDLI